MPTRKPKPQEPAVDQAGVRRVVAVARRQFLTHGFRSVSMDDLAAELGISKKTLYVCFPSKTALLEAVLKDKFSEVEKDLERVARDQVADVEVALHQLLDCVQRHTTEIQPAFVRDLGREAPELFQFIEQRRRELIRRYFGGLFEDGKETGVIRTDIPTHLIIEILLGAVQGIMNPPKLMELGLTVERGYSSVIRLILEGVLLPKGKAVT
ncbi:Transcriptional regulator [Candidatus Nitrospira nitrosa]|uniref:Transcriptional regulator n=1 Tax=Candidatus Nitrospira nitrosa TaxID=1742972 RepID=A0A0S4LHJ2_9BACT|nr:TetR/AcrR family transcriptional regulator [Candidatus Nitrospira nitrosa]CUS36048.1 Transcriptional regulator [Candidatus Nitrospira nitrosa]